MAKKELILKKALNKKKIASLVESYILIGIWYIYENSSILYCKYIKKSWKYQIIPTFFVFMLLLVQVLLVLFP